MTTLSVNSKPSHQSPADLFLLRLHWMVVSSFVLLCTVSSAVAQDVSSPALLQVYEARWQTVEDRMVDVFAAGYGGMWLPPPNRADSGGLSVGYDVFDRFDFGKPRNETLYGTDNYFKKMVEMGHRAGVNSYADFMINHNGFSDTNRPGFVAEGDYPGFVLELPNDPNGDFHPEFFDCVADEELCRLSGLIDIDHTKNHQFIRHPVDANDPLNIPSGSLRDIPDPNNARFYQDRDLGGTQVFNPGTNSTVTLYDFNSTNPLAGDAVTENATGLLMRNMRWMIQEMGVDGFRFDAGRHFPRWVYDFVDEAMFLAKKTPLLDGSIDHAFGFTETGYDSNSFLQSFIRKDIDPNNLGTIGGNRDALDFNLFGAIRENLTSNGFVNDWRNIKNASIDVNDDGFANNGSQGVAFARSHDEVGSYLDEVAHAYVLMRPGNAIVYTNSGQFGPTSIRDFPRGGRDDALGGFYGDAITTLTTIRNSHGRGNYNDRTPGGSEKELLIYEREKSAVVALNNRLDSGFDSRTVGTAFEPGTPLIELTGNATNATVDPNDDIADFVVVKPDGSIDIQVPRNRTGSVEHGKGYVIYGVSGPQGEMSFTDATGAVIADTVAGGTPTATTFGTVRLNEYTVVTDDQFNIRLETDAVTIGTVRDVHADGDEAYVRIDGGLDINGNGSIEHVTPGSVSYGFEEFVDIHQPGYFATSGEGLYQQSVDATQLSEGVHFVTTRAFRHRNAATGGDGGPAVFTDFRQAIYVDRLPPESSIASFDPYGTDAERDLVVQSLDETADSVHVFLNLPANLTEQQILALVGGSNQAGQIDRDLFVYGFGNVRSGNNVATVVTYEVTGNYSVIRVPATELQPELNMQTGFGAGIGDLNANNVIDAADLLSPGGGFETVLYSRNDLFNPGADATGDGLVDTRDLFLFGSYLVAGNASAPALDAFCDVVNRRGDVNQDGMTDAADIEDMVANFGSDDWFYDLNVDGTTDQADVDLLIGSIFGTLAGDANLDGVVNGIDFIVWNTNKFTSGTDWASGDFNGDGVTNGADFVIWNTNKFQTGSGCLGGLPHLPAPVAVPEPVGRMMLLLAIYWGVRRIRRS